MASTNRQAPILVDPISNPPDSLISEILSSIPTKDDVATSILSRSWRFRWTTVTSFYFDNVSERSTSHEGVQTMDFPEFINTVLLRHCGHSINKFVLVWESADFRPVDLNSWINIAISRNVRVLDLKTQNTDHGSVSEQCEFHLPSSLYTSGTLEILKLEGHFKVETPKVVYLPNVAEMELVHVIYESDQSLHALVCGCPFLDSLAIVRVNDKDNLVVCSITSPFLRQLMIDFQDISGKQSDGMQLIINAPELISLYIFDYLSSHISIQSRLTIMYAGALVAPLVTDKKAIVEVLEGFGHMKDMILNEQVMIALEKVALPLPVGFKSLARLALNLHRLPRGNCLMHLLDGCINLEKLEIRSRQTMGDSWKNPGRASSCLSTSLRHLTFTRFDGFKKEMAMLKFFLDHGLVLERVYLSCDWNSHMFNHAERSKTRKKVSKLSRASPNCKIYWHEASGAVV